MNNLELQQRLRYRQILRKNNIAKRLLVSFCHCILTYCNVCVSDTAAAQTLRRKLRNGLKDQWLPSPHSGRVNIIKDSLNCCHQMNQINNNKDQYI